MSTAQCGILKNKYRPSRVRHSSRRRPLPTSDSLCRRATASIQRREPDQTVVVGGNKSPATGDFFATYSRRTPAIRCSNRFGSRPTSMFLLSFLRTGDLFASIGFGGLPAGCVRELFQGLILAPAGGHGCCSAPSKQCVRSRTPGDLRVSEPLIVRARRGHGNAHVGRASSPPGRRPILIFYLGYYP